MSDSATLSSPAADTGFAPSRQLAARPLPLTIILLVVAIAWQLPAPGALSQAAFHTAIVFIATIAAIVANVMSTGAIAIIAMAAYCILRPAGEASAALAVNNALANFNNALIWLIVIAFMIARAFSKTGLGRRIALLLLSRFGQSSLRVAYCLGLADFLIAPATPSNTARAAIISPISHSLAQTINAKDRKLGQFLMSSSSAMNDASAVAFQTGFAGNLALVGIATTVAGVSLSFTQWLGYLLVPALALLMLLPLVLYRVIRPQTQQTPEAPAFAKRELAKMGATTRDEWVLIGVFIALIVMWVGGNALGIHATGAAFIGLSALLLLGVLSWDDVKSEKGAWDTLVWFSVLMGMAEHLRNLGFTNWVGDGVSEGLSALLGASSPMLLLLAMMCFYLFTAYFFASATAKVVALAPVLLGALIGLQVDPLLATLCVAGVTNLGCNLTTYSHARNPLLMGYGYHSDSEWMKLGLVIAIAAMVIFMSSGLLWWRALGL